MKLQTPSEFFAQNGGADLLQANGSTDTPSLNCLLSRQWPVWPKEGEAEPSGKRTRPGTAPVPATLVVSRHGVVLRSAAMMQATPSSTIGKGVVGNKIFELAWTLMDLPRPILMVVAGASYRNAISVAQLTLDPNLVECFGSEAFVLDRDRVTRVGEFAAHFGMQPSKLKALRGSVEFAIAHPNSGNTSTLSKRTYKHPNHPALVKQARTALGLSPKMTPDHADADLEALAAYWGDIASLPPVDDPAWHIAEQIHLQNKAPSTHDA